MAERWPHGDCASARAGYGVRRWARGRQGARRQRDLWRSSASRVAVTSKPLRPVEKFGLPRSKEQRAPLLLPIPKFGTSLWPSAHGHPHFTGSSPTCLRSARPARCRSPIPSLLPAPSLARARDAMRARRVQRVPAPRLAVRHRPPLTTAPRSRPSTPVPRAKFGTARLARRFAAPTETCPRRKGQVATGP